ncbi:MAG: alcohol dehydrogenase catalytic domain-containing protein [Polyangiales bacterium]
MYTTMKAMQVRAAHGELTLVELPIPEPRENEVLLKVEACGVCHGDAVVKEGQFPHLHYPRVPGHEVVGSIAQLGERVRGWKLGQRVGVGWHGGHCFSCKACRHGKFGACESALVTGISSDGGYAEYMVARAEALVEIPERLRSIAAAPILCAGSTTLAALESCGAAGGDLVAVHGLGGLGHLAVQYAVKLGFRTVAMSRGHNKEEIAHALGVHRFIDTSNTDAAAELRGMGGARIILCTAPHSAGIAALVDGLAFQGQLVVVTFVEEPMRLPLSALMRGGRSIVGWVGGDMDHALKFSVHAGIAPIVETYPLAQAATAYERMMSSQVKLRAVLTMGAQT